MLLAMSAVVDQEVGGFGSLLGVVGPLSYAYDTAVVVGVMLLRLARASVVNSLVMREPG